MQLISTVAEETLNLLKSRHKTQKEENKIKDKQK
jgi:hypothetical protein